MNIIFIVKAAGVFVLVVIVVSGGACDGGGLARGSGRAFSGLYPSGGHPLTHPRYHLILLRGGGFCLIYIFIL